MSQLLDKIKSASFDNLRDEVDTLNQLAWQINRSDPRSTIDYAEKALKLANSENYLEGIAFAKMNLGMAYCWLSQYDRALSFSYESLRSFEYLGIIAQTAQCFYNLGAVYYYLGEYENSLTYSFKSLNRYQSISDNHGIARAFNGIGSTYSSLLDYEKAIDYLSKAEIIMLELNNDFELLTRIYDGLARAYYCMHDLDLALEYGNKCVAWAIKSKVPFCEAYGMEILGDTYIRLGELKKAKELLINSLKIREDIGFANGILTCKLKLAEIALKSDNFERGMEILMDSLTFSIERKMYEYQLKIHRSLAQIYEEKGDYKKFAVHLKRAYKIREEIIEKQSLQRSKAIELQLGIERAGRHESEQVVERTKEDTKVLSEIGKLITSTLNLEEAMRIMYSRISELMDADAFAIRIVDKNEQIVNCVYEMDAGERGEGISFGTEENNLTNWCIKNGEIFMVDYEQECIKYGLVPKAVFGNMPKSLIFQPLEFQNEIIGIITTQSYRKNAFQEYHLNILRTLASYMSIAIQNARLFEEMEDKVRQRTTELKKSFDDINALNKLGELITASLSVQEINQIVFENLQKLKPIHRLGVAIYNKDAKGLDYKFIIDNDKVIPHLFVSENTLDLGISCYLKDEHIILKSGDKHPVLPVNKYPSLYFPIRNKGKKMGVLFLELQPQVIIEKGYIQIVNNLVNFVGVALENAELYQSIENEVLDRTKEINKARNDARLISEIGRTLTSTFVIEEMLDILYKQIGNLMACDAFAVRLYDPKRGMIDCVLETDKGKKGQSISISINEENNMTVWCIKNKKEVFTNDYQLDSKKFVTQSKAVFGGIPSSIIFIPLIVRDNVLGVITTQSYEKNAFTEYHLNVLRSLSSYVAIGVHNARLYEDMEGQVRARTYELDLAFKDLERLNQIGEKITSCISIKEINDVVYAHVSDIMLTTNFGIGVLDETKENIEFKYCIEHGEYLPDFKQSLKDEKRLASFCYNNQRLIHINAADEINKLLGIAKYSASAGVFNNSIIYIPIIGKSGSKGVVTVQAREKFAYSTHHVNLLANLTNFIAIALENAHLYEHMEDEIELRTSEIEKARHDTKLLSEVGREITASLEVQKVIEIVYQNITSLMSSDCFGLRLIDRERGRIVGVFEIENGKRFEGLEFSISAENNPSVWCIEHKKEMIVNDREKEYTQYIKVPTQLYGSAPNSVMFIPLIAANEVIGVITVQSWKKTCLQRKRSEYFPNVSFLCFYCNSQCQTLRKHGISSSIANF